MLEQCVRWNRALHGTSKRVVATAAAGGADAANAASEAQLLPPSEQAFLDEHSSCAALFTNPSQPSRSARRTPLSKQVALLERALSLSEKQHGSRVHPEVAVILTNLGMAYGGASAAEAAEGRIPEAQAVLQKGLSTLQQVISIKTSLYSAPIHNDVALTLSNTPKQAMCNRSLRA